MIPRELLLTTMLLLALATGMGIYVLHLQRGQNMPPAPPREAEPVSPPQQASAMQTVTVWVASDRDSTLRPQAVTVPLNSDPQQHAEDLLHALLKLYRAPDSPHPMAAGAELRSVYLASSGLVVIDVNSAFAEGQTSGVLPEELTLVSFARTLAGNLPGAARLKFLVDGKEHETLAGHADLAGSYDVSDISNLAKQLSVE